MPKTILLVDDEQEILEIYADAVEMTGFVVSGTALNGREAVDIFKTLSVKPDVILMDHRMPVKSGLEAAAEILLEFPDAKIIIASADKSVEHEAVATGVAAFLKKPFSLEYLIETIEKI